MSDRKDSLSAELIDRYWNDFKSCSTWNYYNWAPKYLEDDVWATKDTWISVSQECLEKDTNVLQALEVLLDLDRDNYIDIAENVLSTWFESGAHDEHYYYDLISYLPVEHKIRKEVLSVESNSDIFGCDAELSLLRRALARASDRDFIELSGGYLNDLLQRDTLDIDLLEYSIMPVLMDLGRYAKSCVSVSNLDRLKRSCLNFYEKDRIQIETLLLGDFEDSDQRRVWVGDNLAYWAWVLGWQDMLSDLDRDDLYWAAMFSELWGDEENTNLLIWAALKDSKILRNRASVVMKTHELHRLDGAIALSRMAN